MPRTMMEGRHGLAIATHGRREMWGTDPITGKLREIIHLPGNSWWPLFAALALAVVCLSLLTRLYPLAGVAVVVAVIFLLRWSWENGAHPNAAPDARVEPGDPPLHSRTMDGPGLWAMAIALLANGSFFLSYLLAGSTFGRSRLNGECLRHHHSHWWV
ncbi:hypothetical protein HSBAA_39980 [Vreelandella sulfidaeris]|uniref:Uncharacterized protein n=1 Tax=Vreelandella sulfidaeris TaxID=115553 RepID=A0A455U936_9GAMM|nr:hypothetical protein HSBAA_39980 [Halomonas sulfidaeris]